MAEFGTLIKDQLRFLQKPTVQLLSKKIFRQMLTGGYKTGLAAIGERNSYRSFPFWVTIDCEDADICVDLEKLETLPLEAGSQKAIYTAHTLEHLKPATYKKLLADIYRVLAPGGILRVEVPDARKIVDAYRARNTTFFNEIREQNTRQFTHELKMGDEYSSLHIAFLGLLSLYIKGAYQIPVLASEEEIEKKLQTLSFEDFLSWAISLQTPEQYNSGGHINPLYFDKMKADLEGVGFHPVQDCGPFESQLPKTALRVIERTHRAYYSFFVEAIKPITV